MRLFDLRSLPTRVLGVSAVALLGLSARVYPGGDGCPERLGRRSRARRLPARRHRPIRLPGRGIRGPGLLPGRAAGPRLAAGTPAVCRRRGGRRRSPPPTFTDRRRPPAPEELPGVPPRPGRSAPFPLITYEEAKRHAFDIATVTVDRRMPPWLASHRVRRRRPSGTIAR